MNMASSGISLHKRTIFCVNAPLILEKFIIFTASLHKKTTRVTKNRIKQFYNSLEYIPAILSDHSHL